MRVSLPRLHRDLHVSLGQADSELVLEHPRDSHTISLPVGARAGRQPLSLCSDLTCSFLQLVHSRLHVDELLLVSRLHPRVLYAWQRLHVACPRDRLVLPHPRRRQRRVRHFQHPPRPVRVSQEVEVGSREL
eukprot:762103-Hanusia_phi.AAC.3